MGLCYYMLCNSEVVLPSQHLFPSKKFQSKRYKKKFCLVCDNFVLIKNIGKDNFIFIWQMPRRDIIKSYVSAIIVFPQAHIYVIHSQHSCFLWSRSKEVEDVA